MPVFPQWPYQSMRGLKVCGSFPHCRPHHNFLLTNLQTQKLNATAVTKMSHQYKVRISIKEKLKFGFSSEKVTNV
jgi:hypothetical protein